MEARRRQHLDGGPSGVPPPLDRPASPRHAGRWAAVLLSLALVSTGVRAASAASFVPSDGQAAVPVRKPGKGPDGPADDSKPPKRKREPKHDAERCPPRSPDRDDSDQRPGKRRPSWRRDDGPDDCGARRAGAGKDSSGENGKGSSGKNGKASRGGDGDSGDSSGSSWFSHRRDAGSRRGDLPQSQPSPTDGPSGADGSLSGGSGGGDSSPTGGSSGGGSPGGGSYGSRDTDLPDNNTGGGWGGGTVPPGKSGAATPGGGLGGGGSRGTPPAAGSNGGGRSGTAPATTGTAPAPVVSPGTRGPAAVPSGPAAPAEGSGTAPAPPKGPIVRTGTDITVTTGLAVLLMLAGGALRGGRRRGKKF
jgi:hypothetical protein